MDDISMPDAPIQYRCEQAVSRLLKSRGLQFNSLSEVPLPQIRHNQRGAFPDMRMVHLATALRESFLGKPILKDLLCTRVGYQGPSTAHYIPRPLGSYDCIFIFCVGGRGWLEINGKTYLIEKHGAFLIPPHTPHKYGADPDHPWANYWIHFQGKQVPDYVSIINSEAGNPAFHIHLHQLTTGMIEQLYQHMSQVHTYSGLVAASGVLAQLLGNIQLNMRAAEKRPRTAEENIDRTVTFMSQNLSCKLSLKELANIAGMSVNHYGTMFARRYENSPIDYFNRLKMQRACELLKTSDFRISEIGEQLGIEDPYYFSRLFKKIMGVPPKHYR